MNTLTDRFGRIHDYLRISVTDQCNFRCTYCMPSDYHSETTLNSRMSPEEIEGIASIFIKEGVKKIRLTGGEPFVRKDIGEIITRLGKHGVQLMVTTNGSLLEPWIPLLKKYGLHDINVSLDSLNPSNFACITKRNQFSQVWCNIQSLLDHKYRVKINVVAMKGKTEKEIINFISLTKDLPLHIRFIEFMPFRGNFWKSDEVLTANQMLTIAEQTLDIIKLKDDPHSTAKKYKAISHIGTFAFITTMSQQFCHSCNRLRLTSEGKMKNCLFSQHEIDLLGHYRAGENIIPYIQQHIHDKKEAGGGQWEGLFEKIQPEQVQNRTMISIGG